MRILTVLTLGLIALAGLFFGIRLIWRVVHPASAPEPLPVPEWLNDRLKPWLLIAAFLLLVIPILMDLLSTQQEPGEHQPPPPLPSTSLAPRSPR